MNQTPQKPRKLLIVTFHFPPSGAVAAYRMLGFSRHLPSYGWKVGVVAPPHTPHEPVDEALVRRVPPETTVFSAPYSDSPLSQGAGRMLHGGVWLPRARAALDRALKRFQPDVVLTSGPPHCVHLLGMYARRIGRLPWVADLRDPWFTDHPTVRNSWFWSRWERFWEKRGFHEADCIIANTPGALQGLERTYPDLASKMVCVTNGFDPEFFPPHELIVPHSQPWTIVHAGEIYAGRDPRPFFDALAAMRDTLPNAQLPFMTRMFGKSTDPRVDLPLAIQQRGLESAIELVSQVPYAQALNAMSKADVLLLIDSPGKKVGIPAKLFEYVGAGRPILALVEPDSDAAWALQVSGAPHRIAPPQDAGKLRQALQELRDELEHPGLVQAQPRQQLATFTRAKLAQDLAGHLERMVFGTANKKAKRPRRNNLASFDAGHKPEAQAKGRISFACASGSCGDSRMSITKLVMRGPPQHGAPL